MKHLSLFSAMILLSATLVAQKRQTPPEYAAKSHQQHTMMLLGQLDTGGGLIATNANDIIYAFIDGECRGTANPMSEHDGLIFLSIAENTEQSQPITFMVWLDERQELLPLNETLTFEPLAAVGDLDNPLIFTLGEMVGLNETDGGIWIGEPYPNPFTEQTVVPFRLSAIAKTSWELYNSLGQKVRYSIETQYGTGMQYIQIDRATLLPGIYVLQIQIQSGEQSLQKQLRLVVK